MAALACAWQCHLATSVQWCSQRSAELSDSYTKPLVQAHETAKSALDQAKQQHQAAQLALQQPFFFQQPYWCDGAGTTASALEGWQKAGLPLRAVVYLRAPTSEAGTQVQDTPPLITGTMQC